MKGGGGTPFAQNRSGRLESAWNMVHEAYQDGNHEAGSLRKKILLNTRQRGAPTDLMRSSRNLGHVPEGSARVFLQGGWG